MTRLAEFLPDTQAWIPAVKATESVNHLPLLPGSISTIPPPYRPMRHRAATTPRIPVVMRWTMLCPGSDGRADNDETVRANDPPSVAQTLAEWQDDWRHCARSPSTPSRAH